jgi:hypothetical protein
MIIIVTNNPMVREKFSGRAPAAWPLIGADMSGSPSVLDFHDTDCLGVFLAVRDRIHLGHSLLTHPLSGSVKPGETLYKTVIVTGEKSAGKKPFSVDEESLAIIEDSIQTCMKLKASVVKKEWGDKILLDFQLIDYSLIFV